MVLRDTLRSAIAAIVHDEVRKALPALLSEMLLGESSAPAKRGRPAKAAASVEGEASEPKKRGRRRALSDEERRRRAAAYQRMYRARQKASKKG